jgi:hypothetical protein
MLPTFSQTPQIWQGFAGSGSRAALIAPATWFHSYMPDSAAANALSRRIWNAPVFSTSKTVLPTIVPDEMRGRVMGVWSVVFGAMIPLGSLEAGAVAHFAGTPFALAFGAIICAVSALVTLLVIRRREAQLPK